MVYQLPNGQCDPITWLRCPDCLNELTPVDARRCACTRCERQYSIDNGVIVLLPRKLDLNKQAEELNWQTLEHEGKDNLPGWP